MILSYEQWHTKSNNISCFSMQTIAIFEKLRSKRFQQIRIDTIATNLIFVLQMEVMFARIISTSNHAVNSIFAFYSADRCD